MDEVNEILGMMSQINDCIKGMQTTLFAQLDMIRTLAEKIEQLERKSHDHVAEN